MSDLWLWDFLAFVGAATFVVLAVSFAWFSIEEIQRRRTLDREMREFNRSIEAVSRIWRQDRE